MRVLIGAALIVALSPAWGQHYRWTDERGRIHFSDSPPPASAKNVHTLDAASAPAEAPADPYALQEARRNFPVTLYSAAGCEACDEARKVLNGRGVPFREVSVTTREEHEALQAAAGGAVVPTMVVGKRPIKGFDEASYQVALDTAGYPKKGVLPPRKQGAPAPAKTQNEPAQTEPEPRGPYAPRTGPASPVLTPEPERRVLR